MVLSEHWYPGLSSGLYIHKHTCAHEQTHMHQVHGLKEEDFFFITLPLEDFQSKD